MLTHATCLTQNMKIQCTHCTERSANPCRNFGKVCDSNSRTQRNHTFGINELFVEIEEPIYSSVTRSTDYTVLEKRLRMIFQHFNTLMCVYQIMLNCVVCSVLVESGAELCFINSELIQDFQAPKIRRLTLPGITGHKDPNPIRLNLKMRTIELIVVRFQS